MFKLFKRKKDYSTRNIHPSEKLKIGQRVIGVNFSDFYNKLNNQKGIIIFSDETHVGVQFDKSFDFLHDCNGRGKKKSCRWFLKEYNGRFSDQNLFNIELYYTKRIEF